VSTPSHHPGRQHPSTSLGGTRTGSPPNFRRAARAILVTPAHEVLLVRFEFPAATVWALPGGGLDPGEDDIAALRRELREELGLVDVAIGPHVWTREHVIPMLTGHDGQRDHVHLVPVERFDPEPEIGWDALRDEFVHEMRWWTIDEIDAATRPTVEHGSDVPERRTWFAPRRLAALLRDLVAHGPPASAVDTGV
jgi:8-oxo-dGTP diphosphatase